MQILHFWPWDLVSLTRKESPENNFFGVSQGNILDILMSKFHVVIFYLHFQISKTRYLCIGASNLSTLIRCCLLRSLETPLTLHMNIVKLWIYRFILLVFAKIEYLFHLWVSSFGLGPLIPFFHPSSSLHQCFCYQYSFLHLSSFHLFYQCSKFWQVSSMIFQHFHF